jgi:hypothetical protein
LNGWAEFESIVEDSGLDADDDDIAGSLAEQAEDFDEAEIVHGGGGGPFGDVKGTESVYTAGFTSSLHSVEGEDEVGLLEEVIGVEDSSADLNDAHISRQTTASRAGEMHTHAIVGHEVVAESGDENARTAGRRRIGPPFVLGHAGPPRAKILTSPPGRMTCTAHARQGSKE